MNATGLTVHGCRGGAAQPASKLTDRIAVAGEHKNIRLKKASLARQ